MSARAPERWPPPLGAATARAALASGALFAISFPPFPLAPLAFVAPVPLAVAIARQADGGTGAGDSAMAGLAFGALAYACTLSWIATALWTYTPLSPIGWITAVALLALVVALAAAAMWALRRRAALPMALALPLAWTAHETLLAHLGDLSFPWLPLGLALAPVPSLAQIADLSGVRGMSFWIAAIAGLLADAWLRWRPTPGAPIVTTGVHRVVRPVLIALALLAAGIGYGAWRMRTVTMRPLARIAVVQPSIAQGEKWQRGNRAAIAGTLAALTRRVAAETSPALVVWPEAALPGTLEQFPPWRDSLRAVEREASIPIVAGVLEGKGTSREDERYNSAMLVGVADGNGPPPYRKRMLVPIVEHVPFVRPEWLRAAGLPGGYAHGARAEPWRLPFGRAGALICFESAFPERAREHRRRGADVILILTNDAWFGRSLAPWQHAAHMSLRAIETRAAVVRAANAGISGYADPLGVVHGATELFTPVARAYDTRTSNARTLYTRAGDWVGTLSLVATAALAAGALRRGDRGSRS